MTIPTLADVLAAQDRLLGRAVRTPLVFSPVLSERLAASVYLKLECLQRTGSFKFRGAWNALRVQEKLARERGVVAVSSGNHAQGVAEAARLISAPATIVMPADAPVPKRRRTERSGATVVSYDRVTEDRDAVVAAVFEQRGGIFIHPYNDPLVIAGQGTVGLEIAEDFEPLGATPDIAVVPCSGGGLSAGVALALTEKIPGIQVHVAEPAGFDDYRRSLETGTRQQNSERVGSVCDALLAPKPGEIGWEMNRRRLAGGVAVSDEEALYAVGCAFEELRVVVEPGGAVALAALLAGRLGIAGKKVAVVLSGGNIDDKMLRQALRIYRSAGKL
jgi:threonine dehydratase